MMSAQTGNPCMPTSDHELTWLRQDKVTNRNHSLTENIYNCKNEVNKQRIQLMIWDTYHTTQYERTSNCRQNVENKNDSKDPPMKQVNTKEYVNPSCQYLKIRDTYNTTQ